MKLERSSRFAENTSKSASYFNMPPTQRSFDRRTLTLNAAARAMRLRRRLGFSLNEAICPFDVAEKLGVEVRFESLPSMEGMYCQRQNQAPLIVLAAERPDGRQRFNCAHELGHNEFKHGTRLDELVEASPELQGSEGQRPLPLAKWNDPDEFLADRFASFLLMTRAAVDYGLAVRGIKSSCIQAVDAYALSCWLGVGYRSLVEHLCFSLEIISREQREMLRSVRLPQVRTALAGRPVKNVVVADEHWNGRPIDLHVGDVLSAPKGWQVDGKCLALEGATLDGLEKQSILACALQQGQSEVFDPATGNSWLARVSRQGYSGRSKFRHLDDPDE